MTFATAKHRTTSEMAGLREPEPWESNAAAPFLTIDFPRGPFAVRARPGALPRNGTRPRAGDRGV